MESLRFSCVPFDLLTPLELYRIMALRQEVFIVEQNCPYLDADGKDLRAWHLTGWATDGRAACHARLLPAGVSYPGYASIGRVVSASFVRGTGAGKQLMTESLRCCRLLFGDVPVKISAQTYLLGFYESLGFRSTGKAYLEDGIPHTEMVWKG